MLGRASFAAAAAVLLAELRGAASVRIPVHPSALSALQPPPEQIRIALTHDPTEMVVFWATANTTTDAYEGSVVYGTSPGEGAHPAEGHSCLQTRDALRCSRDPARATRQRCI